MKEKENNKKIFFTTADCKNPLNMSIAG